MKKLFLVSALCLSTVFAKSQQNDNHNSSDVIMPYLNFIKEQKTSAKDYVLKLFEKHDIVILCERMHPEITQYHLILDIIKDERFIKNVGNVFTEIGNSNLNPEINEVLHKSGLDSLTKEMYIRKFHRNASFYPLWENYNYTYLLRGLFNINDKLNEKLKINYFPSDMPFNWAEMNKDSYKVFFNRLVERDSIMADQIIKRFDGILASKGKRKKALVIMNFRHAFGNFRYANGSKPDNVGRYLFEKYNDKVANVYLNYVSLVIGKNNKNSYTPIHNGKWDAAFSLAGNPNIGFNFKGSPFGKDSFDLLTNKKQNLTFNDVFTGFVFYLPLEKHLTIAGVPGIIGSDFEQEIQRRAEIFGRGFPTDINSLRELFENKREKSYTRLPEYKNIISSYLYSRSDTVKETSQNHLKSPVPVR